MRERSVLYIPLHRDQGNSENGTEAKESLRVDPFAGTLNICKSIHCVNNLINYYYALYKCQKDFALKR